MVWDGRRPHWSKEVRDFVATLGGEVQLEQLSADAPELNPVAYFRGYLKQPTSA